jgi:hypothetical protein
MAASASAVEGVCGYAEQLTPYLRASDSRSLNDVYFGIVILPDRKTRTRAFVKVFPPANRGQLVFNEVFGHQIALQCGLPTPYTFPCACPTPLIRRSTLDRWSDGVSDHLFAVASIEGEHKEIVQRGGSSAMKWADLMNWPHIANVAVFDELMGNDDRHISNLIRSGPQDYILIDNERILFGELWFDSDLHRLVRRRCDSNVLADSIAEGTDEVMRQRMISYAQRYVMETRFDVPAACERIEELCGAPKSTTKGLIQMLNQRRQILPTLMQWHMQKGDLFQTSSIR